MIRVMPVSIAAMKVGLRVLTAISNPADPAPRHVEELLRFAPECSGLRADDLACEVIHRALTDPPPWWDSREVFRSDPIKTRVSVKRSC